MVNASQVGLFEEVKPPMVYTPRPYQAKGTEAAIWYLKNYGNPFIVLMATGAGKSIVIADICRKLDEPVLILQPSKEILEQNYAKLQSYGITDISIYSASMKQKVISKYTYATIGSIYKKPELFKHFKYVIIDECHLVNPKSLSGMYMKFLKAIDCKNVCGLTATPYRLQGKYIFEGSLMFYTSTLKMLNRIHPFFFKKIVYKVETQDLINQGFLSPIKYIESDMDFSSLKVNTTGANFTEDSVEKFWSGKGGQRLEYLAKTIQTIDKTHKKNLIFCSSIKQATAAVDMLKVMGIECAIVTGTTPAKEREQIIARFKAGVLKHIANVGVFTVGFDVPELDCIVLARPTMSVALYYQMVGRGVRKDPADPSKVLTVYDFAGCVERHGTVESIRVTKEEDGFRDRLETSVGVITDAPLFKFLVKDQSKKGRFAAQAEVQQELL